VDDDQTRIENVEAKLSFDHDTDFCSGAVGGGKWNGPAYDPRNDLAIVGRVDRCTTVTMRKEGSSRAGADGRAVGRQCQVHPDGPVWCLRSHRQPLGRLRVWLRRRHRGVEVAREVELSDHRRREFLGDVGGNFDALDSANGRQLWGSTLAAHSPAA
jgi:alcohol dehydrogenase (cytochrome c)